jgi:F-type H+-transporting ATPase subunit gamma
MPSLKAIRTRIASVKNTQKITRAMKHVAAAKLRRAQDSIIAARPYAKRLRQVVNQLGLQGSAGGGPAEASHFEHPLLQVHDSQSRVGILIFTSDRGLCGGFNTNVHRATERFLDENSSKYEKVELSIVGRKGREFFKRRRPKLINRTWGAAANSAEAMTRAREIATDLIADYTGGKLDVVYVVYNEFKSAITQRVVVDQILPIVPTSAAAKIQDDGHGGNLPASLDFVYEPSRRALLDALLPMYVEIDLNRVLLESIASELGAKMSAMDSATSAASDMIASLTLQFNRARQASITKELMEIIGGAEALKG